MSDVVRGAVWGDVVLFRLRANQPMAAGALIMLLGLLPLGAIVASAIPATATLPAPVVFDYNGTDGTDGAVQTYTVPARVTQVVIEAWGAQGGTLACACPGDGTGGSGGHVSGTLAVTPGETLSVRIGGTGLSDLFGSAGGFNGGGAGGNGAGGGGATDVRQGGDTLSDRVLVAGGGGGAGVDAVGGA